MSHLHVALLAAVAAFLIALIVLAPLNSRSKAITPTVETISTEILE